MCRGVLIVVIGSASLVASQAAVLPAEVLDLEEPASTSASCELETWTTSPGLPDRFASLTVSTGDLGGGGALLHRRHRRPGQVLEGRRSRRSRDRRDIIPESYVILKGGGLHVSEEPSTEGLYLGGEIGGTVEGVVDFGFTLDYFYRSSNEMMVLGESEANDLPVRAEVSLEESAAHLVPIGVTFRARLPLGSDRITPFISGTLAYEILYLQNQGTLDRSDPIQAILGEEETFSGFGWQAAAGINVGLSPSIGLFGEAGLHRSTPKQGIELDGVPVDLKVDLDGAFLRGGLRVSL